MQDLMSNSYSAESADYDKEIFVIKLIVCDIGKMGIDDAKESFFHAEIISKEADKNDRKILADLQLKVLSLYRQAYNEYTNKNFTPNEVFSQVHSLLLAQDANVLKSGVEYINFLHKKGLLHQLANKLCTTVVWSDQTNLKDIAMRMQ